MVEILNLDTDTRVAVIGLVSAVAVALIGFLGKLVIELVSKKGKKKEISNAVTINANDNTGKQVIVHGNYNDYSEIMTTKEASKLAIDLFLDNFPKLQEEANCVARERADEICREIINKLQNNNVKDYSSFKEPDMQYILYEAQKSYARFGTSEMLETLTTLISKRVEVDKEMTLKVTIDRAIEIAPMITSEQLDYLSLLFLCSKVKFNNIKTIDQLKNHLESIAQIFKNADFSSIEYLNMLGCFQIELPNVVEIQAKLYNFSESDVDRICPSNLKLLNGDFSTSYVGTVLAIINAQRKTSLSLKMETWIN